MPLKKAVTSLTMEAKPGDDEEIRRAVKAWHNRLANGSVPRKLVIRIGRQLFLDLDEWNAWLDKKGE
jgi:hypothetical protein